MPHTVTYKKGSPEQTKITTYQLFTIDFHLHLFALFCTSKGDLFEINL
jgi:hypothetical protein